MILTAKELDVTARTVWAEARDQVFRGKVGVAETVRNRVVSGKSHFGSKGGFIGVCQKKTVRKGKSDVYQFTCWDPRDTNRKKLEQAHTTLVWHECVAAVLYAVEMNTSLVKGATNYHTTAISPWWSKSSKMKFLIQVDDHRFYFEL